MQLPAVMMKIYRLFSLKTWKTFQYSGPVEFTITEEGPDKFIALDPEPMLELDPAVNFT